MKVLVGMIAVMVVATVVVAQPRKCNVAPAQSSYVHYVAPHAGATANGSYTQPAVYHRRLQANIVSVAQINPAYVSAYSPDGYDSATQADILNELRRLGFRLDQIAAIGKAATAAQAKVDVGPGPVVVPAVPMDKGKDASTTGLAVITAKCAVCHQAGKLAADQRFTLIDMKGNIVPLTDKQKVTLIKKTYRQQMPPPINSFNIPPLTDSEYAAIMDLIQ